jgi:hypothetical protein
MVNIPVLIPVLAGAITVFCAVVIPACLMPVRLVRRRR